MLARLMKHRAETRLGTIDTVRAGDLVQVIDPGQRAWTKGDLALIVARPGQAVPRVVGLGDSRVYDISSLESVKFRILYHGEVVRLQQDR